MVSAGVFFVVEELEDPLENSVEVVGGDVERAGVAQERGELDERCGKRF